MKKLLLIGIVGLALATSACRNPDDRLIESGRSAPVHHLVGP